MRRVIFLSILTILFTTNLASAFWIWTPKTGKWVNPKYAVKPTPGEQLDAALSLYEEDRIKEARHEFNRLLKHYPKSREAAEAQYYLGAIEEKSSRLYEAYLAYQKVIDKYPFSSRIKEIIEKEFEIAEKFMQGEKRKALGVALPVENPAIEIFRQVIDNSTYGPRAAEAQYKLGLILKSLDRLLEAEEEFDKVIKNYPQSEWIAAAEFQIASCRGSISPSPDYDQEATREAKKKFEEFVLAHPDAAISRQAEKSIQELKEREAQSHYDIAVFYEKQEAYKAAKLYYDTVIKDYPGSSWADKALSKLQAMEQKK
ncbi:MAG: outer membrane protein assembly factor BamD [Candidatus Omnitrophica bacterium]|nr:outer membrane protein assembly factor BamD [Candidatus Omnitrophota bacterium]